MIISPGNKAGTYALLPCSTCKEHSPIPYVRALDLKVLCLPAYRQLTEEKQLLLMQREQLVLVQRLFDYDHMLNWARTTRLSCIGIARSKENHPLKRYLQDLYPVYEGWRTSWTIYSSACEALRGFQNVPHSRNFPIFVNNAVQPEGTVSFTMYCPLPLWTRRLLERLQELPWNSKITREGFLALLRPISGNEPQRRNQYGKEENIFLL